MFAQKSELATTVKINKTNCHIHDNAKYAYDCQNKKPPVWVVEYLAERIGLEPMDRYNTVTD